VCDQQSSADGCLVCGSGEAPAQHDQANFKIEMLWPPKQWRDISIAFQSTSSISILSMIAIDAAQTKVSFHSAAFLF
jgi:hypothetical protein